MSRISKLMSLSSSSSPSTRGIRGSINTSGSNNTMAQKNNSSNNNNLITVIYNYVKLFFYVFLALFLILQYIYWKSSTSTLTALSNSNIYKNNILASQQQQQQQTPPQPQVVPGTVLLRHEITTKIHIVFSTGCNAFQDWQSYLFFHQIWKSGQTGHVTRIASGCKDEYGEQLLRDVFDKDIVNGIPNGKDRFHLHITPDFSKIAGNQAYKFFNKPFGVLHWMEHSLGMPQTLDSEYADTLFIILDPDMFILTPFTSNNFNRKNVIDDATRRQYWHEPLPNPNGKKKNTIDPNDYIVREGYPMAQMYLFGSNFVRKINADRESVVQAANAMMKNNSAFAQYDTMNVESSPLYTWTNTDANNYYVVGPPYIAMGRDMYRIVAVWAAMAVPVYTACDGEFLSEMFAYSTAIAHLELPHLISYNFMISDPDINLQEGWNDIDTIPKEQMCDYTQNNSTDTSTIQWHAQYYPYVVHYCQRMFLGPYFFNKYRLPHDFLTCDHPLHIDPTDEAGNYKNGNTVDGSSSVSIVDMYTSAETPDHTVYRNIPIQQRKRAAFMLCAVIGALNDAATYWKGGNCNELGNYSKVYFVPPDPVKN